MIEIELKPNGDLILQPTALNASTLPVVEGIMLHGYGCNKEEMVGLAAHLAMRLGVRLLLFDLPGHSPHDKSLLTMAEAAEAVRERLGLLERPVFFIGHSLGANLGTLTGLEIGVAVSMPGEIVFEGRRRQLMNTLRARRVREKSVYSGLREILDRRLVPGGETLWLYARNDLRSCIDLAKERESIGDAVFTVPECGHLDIVSHPATAARITEWLKPRLPGGADA